MVWSIHEDPSGSLWFGTNGGGLIRLARGRVRAYTTRDGLFTDTIFRVLDDERGHLWMSSNQGVFRIAIADLDALDAGRLTRVASVSYSEHDGMRSREANGGVQPAGWKAQDGRLWFPTLKGVAVFDPSHANAGAAVSAVIEDVLVDRSPFDLRANTVSPAAKEIEFHYTAPNLLAAHRLQFKYRLEGFDDTWVEAGAQRSARYTNLPPGDYRFRVVASNGDGGWNDSESSLSFTRSPHWYQTIPSTRCACWRLRCSVQRSTARASAASN
jgi:hypothetical protein